jgi:hypothetical protein
MKQLILLSLYFIVLSFSIRIEAQNKIQGFDVMGTKEIDSGTIRIYYNFIQIDSSRINANGSKNTDYKTVDVQCLEIGSRLSKYYSYAVLDNALASKEWRKKNPTAGSMPIWITTVAPAGAWSEYMWSVSFKDFSTNQFEEYIQTVIPAPLYPYSYEFLVTD